MDLSSRILDCLPHSIFVLDKELRLAYANRNFIRFFKEQFGAEAAIGEEILSAVRPERRSHFELRLKEILGGACARVEESMDINDRLQYFDVTYQPMEENGEWSKVVISFEEITDRKRRELRLMDTEDHLKQLVETRETLLSVISHDLRSPIFQLNGLLFLIKQATEKRDEARLLMQAEDLEERIGHLTHTLDNLLNWSNLQRQNLDPNLSCFKLRTAVLHAVGLFKPIAKRKAVELRVGDLSGIELVSDREMVAFIIRNLVNNAIKFSMQSGLVEIEAAEDGDFVTLTVRDYGVGIEPKRVSALMEGGNTFSQAGTWGERGTGLGLALCYEFAERLNGSLNIDSGPSGGTVVKVSLPKLEMP